MKPRYYQEDASKALISTCWDARENTAPVVVIPCGGGKTIVIAEFIRQTMLRYPGAKGMVLAHRKELVRQNAEKMLAVWPEADIGVYSAGLGRKEVGHAVTYAGIQSAARKPELFGHLDFIIVDEAHRIPVKGDGQYRKFIESMKEINPNMRVVGLTATPFRTAGGMICKPENILNKIVYQVKDRKLIDEGYLTRPVGVKGDTKVGMAGVKKASTGDFILSQMGERYCAKEVVEDVVEEIIHHGKQRPGWIIFGCDIAHGDLLSDELESRGFIVPVINEKTPAKERDEIIRMFDLGGYIGIINCGVLTEGFDSPRIQMVAIARATMSPGLAYQMWGRGVRLHPDKKDVLFLDFGGNISRHGPYDNIVVNEPSKGKGQQPMKSCPKCHFESVPAAARECPECQHQFPEVERVSRINRGAYDGDVLSSEATTHQVRSTRYMLHTKKATGVKSLKVVYDCGPLEHVSVYLPFNTGAGFHAKAAWKGMVKLGFSNFDPPKTSEEALKRAWSQLKTPASLVTKEVNGYPKVVQYVWDN